MSRQWCNVVCLKRTHLLWFWTWRAEQWVKTKRENVYGSLLCLVFNFFFVCECFQSLNSSLVSVNGSVSALNTDVGELFAKVSLAMTEISNVTTVVEGLTNFLHTKMAGTSSVAEGGSPEGKLTTGENDTHAEKWLPGTVAARNEMMKDWDWEWVSWSFPWTVVYRTDIDRARNDLYLVLIHYSADIEETENWCVCSTDYP